MRTSAVTVPLLVMSLACSKDPEPGGASGAGGRGGAGPMDAGNGGSTGGPDAPVATGDPCELAAQLCDRDMACGGQFINAFYGDVPTCRARITLECRRQAALPDTAITVEAVDACIKEAAAATCPEFYEHGMMTCKLRGKRSRQEACAIDAQCGSGHCQIEAEGTCGKCVALAKETDDCDPDVDTCEPGLDCLSGKCTAAPKAGGACDPDEMLPCYAGYYCMAGKCVATLTTAGATCDDSSACATPLICNLGTGKCELPKYAAPGEVCLSGAGDQALCRAGMCALTITDAGATGTCQALSKDGEPCDYNQQKGCHPPAVCDNGTCKMQPYPACM